jgi:ribosomal-protein-alanine N-acetyltransferase
MLIEKVKKLNYTIITERLILKTPQTNDAEDLFTLMSDSKLTRFLAWEPHKDSETTLTLLTNLIAAQENDKGYHWCVWLENKIIGLVSLIDVKRKIRTWTLDRAEISYWIDFSHQGKGFATEASRAVLDFGFAKLNLHKIIIAHAVENKESESICKKLGFKQYAHEHEAFQKNDKWHDLIWYELIKDRL